MAKKFRSEGTHPSKGFQFTEAEINKLDAIAAEQGSNRSVVVRQLVDQFASGDMKVDPYTTHRVNVVIDRSVAVFAEERAADLNMSLRDVIRAMLAQRE